MDKNLVVTSIYAGQLLLDQRRNASSVFLIGDKQVVKDWNGLVVLCRLEFIGSVAAAIVAGQFFGRHRLVVMVAGGGGGQEVPVGPPKGDAGTKQEREKCRWKKLVVTEIHGMDKWLVVVMVKRTH